MNRTGVTKRAPQRRKALVRSHAAEIVKRRDAKLRLALEKDWTDVKVGEVLMVDADFETSSCVVDAVHGARLVDVQLRAGIEDAATRVHLRRRDV